MGIGGVLEYRATRAAKILALEMRRPSSKIVHPYSPALYAVSLDTEHQGLSGFSEVSQPQLFRILQGNFREFTF